MYHMYIHLKETLLVVHVYYPIYLSVQKEFLTFIILDYSVSIYLLFECLKCLNVHKKILLLFKLFCKLKFEVLKFTVLRRSLIH